MTRERQRTEALLRSASAAAAWPATPDLRGAVVARIAGGRVTAVERAPGPSAPSIAGSATRVGRRMVVLRAVLLALLALVVAAGVATALGYRLPGLDIVFVERLPPAGTGLDLGSPVPLAEARARGVPRILVPSVLPAPETAYELGAGDRRMVTLVWRAGAGERVLPGTDLSLALSAVPGRTDEGFLSKVLGPGTTIEPVSVGGERGWWIAGEPHDLLVLRPDGTTGVLTSRVAGDTLVFARDGTLYRLESALGRDATLEIAGSLR